LGERHEEVALKELAEAIRSIFEKVADFFDIFDLSFLVSGITALTAVLFWPPVRSLARLQITSTSAKFLLFLVGSYVAGLCCFAAGRSLRMGRRGPARFGRFDDLIFSILQAHGLVQFQPFSDYIRRAEDRGIWRLYIRLWAEARKKLHPSPTLSLLNRYWVLAATYDGVSVALLAWVALVIVWMIGMGFPEALTPWVGVPVVVGITLLAIACSREAGRYVHYQAEELIASIAAAREVR
jgi:hypothetical protein